MTRQYDDHEEAVDYDDFLSWAAERGVSGLGRCATCGEAVSPEHRLLGHDPRRQRIGTTTSYPPGVGVVNDLDCRVVAKAREVGQVRLDAEGELEFPRLDETPGIYRFLIGRASGGKTTAYVGETDRLRRRLQHFRTPGPSQGTNIRLNDLIRTVLDQGGTVGIAVIEEAYGGRRPLDLSEKAARVLVESTWLLSLKAEGYSVESA